MQKPKIAVILDENTSRGGSSYELSKNYFRAIIKSGGIPYGIPYCQDFVEIAVHEFDGFLSVGGGIAFPEEWYISGHKPLFAISERLSVEIGIIKSFLKANKPILGICHGMQLLAGLHGCKLRSDVGHAHKDKSHFIHLVKDTSFGKLIGQSSLTVSSRHSEAVAEASDQVKICATAEEGLIEAIEVPGKRFAIGLQWHQEDFINEDHPGNKIFTAFVREAQRN